MMCRQGFFGAAMLPMSELEYTGIIDDPFCTRQPLSHPFRL